MNKLVEEEVLYMTKQLGGLLTDKLLEPKVVSPKFDENKLDWSLLPMDIIEDIVKVLDYGKKKYSPDGWKTIKDKEKRYYAAFMRHFISWFNGEKIDPESGLPHLSHAMCCLVFLSWFDKHIPAAKEHNGTRFVAC